MITNIGLFFLAPIGTAILVFITIYSLIRPFRRFIWKHIIRLIGPEARSINKEPQRLIASMYLSINDKGLSLMGLLERKSHNPIIYPTVKFKTSIRDLKVDLNTKIPPIAYERGRFQIAVIKYEEIDSIEDGSKIVAKFSCIDDLVEAKINLCEIELKKAVKELEIAALFEIKKILKKEIQLETTRKDSFKDVIEKLNTLYDKKEEPKDVFRFLLHLRELERRMNEDRY